MRLILAIGVYDEIKKEQLKTVGYKETGNDMSFWSRRPQLIMTSNDGVINIWLTNNDLTLSGSVTIPCSCSEECQSVRLCQYLLLGLLQLIQELSCRKQIARNLRTQYVDGTHRPKYDTVTLKSRLRVTQGHWKRNHWTDHTRHTISRVIWR